MNMAIRMLTAALVALTVAGCVVAFGDHRDDGKENWQQLERENREAISRLTAGAMIGDVRRELGTPAFSESFLIDGTQYQVLFYRTQRTRADGMTSRDETTPLIFEEGLLTGWGEATWTRLTGRPLQ